MAGLSLALVVAVGLVVWRVAAPDERYVAPLDQGTTTGGRVEAGGASLALSRLQQAVESGDAGQARALADPDDDVARGRLGALVATAGAARLDDVTFRYLDENGGVDDDGGWVASVATTWRFGGFDQTPARSEVAFGFRTEGDTVVITDVGGEGLRTPVWMSGPVEVRRTSRWLVVAAQDADVDRYAQLAARALPVVTSVVRDWRPRLVVEVPGDLQGLDEALHASSGEYSGIAAVTTTSDGTTGPDAPTHVFVNPEQFDAIEGVGAQVVISHEATHVATDGPDSLAPTWLVEGIADYVALRQVDLPLSTTAGQIIAQVRREGPPKALPGAEEFAAGRPRLGAVYESAWVACLVLAQRRSGEQLLRLYEELSSGGRLSSNLRRVFGWSNDDLVNAWVDQLRTIAK